MTGTTKTRRRINTKVVSDIETGRILSRKAFDYFGPVEMAMGVRFPSVASNVVIGSPALAAETIICTTPPLNIPLDFAQVLLFWYIFITIGASGTGLTLRIRRGTGLTGTQVNVTPTFSYVAGQNAGQSGCYFDTPGAIAGQQYTLTAQIPAGAAASAVGDVSLMALVL